MLPESEDINRRFDYHRPTGNKVQDHEAVREDVKLTAVFLNFILPDGPEKEQALVKLEECLMWANAAIARNT